MSDWLVGNIINLYLFNIQAKCWVIRKEWDTDNILTGRYIVQVQLNASKTK